VIILPAPLLMFVYNRPEHTKKTIEALALNHLAKETDVFIYSDAPKNENSIEKVQLTRNYIENVQNKNLFKSVKLINATKNKGLANSVINGVTEIINKFGQVIVVEDDLVSSKDFLQYMNDALQFYKNSRSVWSISGYNVPIKIPSRYNHDVYLSFRGCSWGWGTWIDRWDKVDWEISDYSIFKSSKKMRNKINLGGRDMANMVDEQMEDKIDSWAIRWCYTQSKLDMYTIYPVNSRIKNIGLDGSGTHSGESNHFDVAINDKNKKCIFEEVEMNKEISKRFQNHYMGLFDYKVLNAKKTLKKSIRVLK